MQGFPVNHCKDLTFAVYLYFIVYFLGPKLPKKLALHSMIAYSKEELLILGGFSAGGTKVDNKYERTIYKLKCSSGTVYRLDSTSTALFAQSKN